MTTQGAAADREIRLRIRCSPMPARQFHSLDEVTLAIERQGKVEDGTELADGSLQFDFPVRVRKHPETGRPNFLGHYVKGTPDKRYICLS